MENLIRQYVDNHYEEIIQDLIELVSTEASTSDLEELKHVRNKIKEIISKRLDLEAEEIEVESTRNVLFTPVFQGEKPIVLIGHYDTVHPIGKIPVVREVNKLKGPGVLDMKCGLIQAIWACKAIKELNLKTNYPVHLAFNGDEEIGSPASTPVLLEKTKNARAAFVLEPGTDQGDLKTGRKGGTAVTIEIFGKASHAGLKPEEGINAIQEMANQILALQALNQNSEGTTVNVGTIQGGTKSNVVPDHVEVRIDVRYKTMEESKRIREAISNIPLMMEGTSKKVFINPGSGPMEDNESNRIIFEAAKQSAKQLGFDIQGKFVGGISDANRVSAAGTPCIDGLGGVGEGMHATHEYLNLDIYKQRIQLLIMLLTKLQ